MGFTDKLDEFEETVTGQECVDPSKSSKSSSSATPASKLSAPPFLIRGAPVTPAELERFRFVRP
jgi:hypothetical protein